MAILRTTLVLLAIAGSGYASERPQLATVHAFSGVDLVTTINRATHTHGGPPAFVAEARLNLRVHDGNAHVVVVKRLVLLHGYCNDDKKWAKRTKLAVISYEVNGWEGSEPMSLVVDGEAASVEIPLEVVRRERLHTPRVTEQ